jgi:hypothetical protein
MASFFSTSGGFFSGPVHAQDELVDLRAVSDGSQSFLNCSEFLRHEDLDGLIQKVSIGLSGQTHGILCSDLQSLLQTGTDLRITQATLLADAQPFEDPIELRGDTDCDKYHHHTYKERPNLHHPAAFFEGLQEWMKKYLPNHSLLNFKK